LCFICYIWRHFQLNNAKVHFDKKSIKIDNLTFDFIQTLFECSWCCAVLGSLLIYILVVCQRQKVTLLAARKRRQHADGKRRHDAEWQTWVTESKRKTQKWKANEKFCYPKINKKIISDHRRGNISFGGKPKSWIFPLIVRVFNDFPRR